jgi:hypothetical protein
LHLKTQADFAGPGVANGGVGTASVSLSYQEWREVLSALQASRHVISGDVQRAITQAFDLARERDRQ